MPLYLESALVLLVFMLLVFLVAIVRRDNSIADVAWGIGFIILAWWMHFFHRHPFSLPVAAMVSIWGVRLALYLLQRNLASGREDWRYTSWRRQWEGKVILNSLFRVFLLQGFLLWIIAFPIFQQSTIATVTGLQIAGILLWTVGFLWEAVADWQLAHFKKQPGNKGKIMNRGLWRFSRHPNYFGEILVWWGLAFFVLPYGNWWACLASPLTITWLLASVSGVPLLESKYAENPDFQHYRQTTNALIPDLRKWFRPGS